MKATTKTVAAPAAASTKPATTKSVATKPATAKPATAKPATAKSTAAKPTAAKPAAVKPTATKPVAARAAAKPAAAKPVVTSPARPASAKPVAPSTPVAAQPVLAAPVPAVVADGKAVLKGKKKAGEKKPKLVRDSFTIPEREYQQIAALKQRVLALGQEVKKSELLRAGLAALSQMTESQLKDALSRLEKIKTGRPAK